MRSLVLFGSGVEQADVVFSLEQTCNTAKPKVEMPSVLKEVDSDMEESSTAKLFLQMKENPEELLQLAPHSGDAIISLTGACFGLTFLKGEVCLFCSKETSPFCLSKQCALKISEEKSDLIISLFTEGVELSFGRPPSPNSIPECPQDLCTPELRQLLSPIFDKPTNSPPAAVCVYDFWFSIRLCLILKWFVWH